MLAKDMNVVGELSGATTVFKKGTPLFAGADKQSFYMLNGKALLINKDIFEVCDGYSVTGLADWIYQKISCVWGIDDLLEEQADCMDTGFPKQREEFINSIAEALEELGFYDITGNTL
jgi:hypothetical protein